MQRDRHGPAALVAQGIVNRALQAAVIGGALGLEPVIVEPEAGRRLQQAPRQPVERRGVHLRVHQDRSDIAKIETTAGTDVR